MPVRKFFRDKDRVTVHGLIEAEGKTVKGRVICVNRKTRYNQNVVVLCDIGDCETIECFCPDGSRWLQGSTCTITLGWPNEKG